jgi:hypothetical protein
MRQHNPPKKAGMTVMAIPARRKSNLIGPLGRIEPPIARSFQVNQLQAPVHDGFTQV